MVDYVITSTFRHRLFNINSRNKIKSILLKVMKCGGVCGCVRVCVCLSLCLSVRLCVESPHMQSIGLKLGMVLGGKGLIFQKNIARSPEFKG